MTKDEALKEIKNNAKKLNDRELLEEIYSKQVDNQSTIAEIRKNTHWAFIMIFVIIAILLFNFPPLWLR